MHVGLHLLGELGFAVGGNESPAVRAAQRLGGHHGRVRQQECGISFPMSCMAARKQTSERARSCKMSSGLPKDCRFSRRPELCRRSGADQWNGNAPSASLDQQWLCEQVLGSEPAGGDEKPRPRRPQADKWAMNLAAAQQYYQREGHSESRGATSRPSSSAAVEAEL